jgi:hypothetical protein
MAANINWLMVPIGAGQGLRQLMKKQVQAFFVGAGEILEQPRLPFARNLQQLF